MKRQEGASLGELLCALVILSVLTMMAMPVIGSWRESAQHRAFARELASIMRECRSRAIATNLEHRVEIDLEESRFRLSHGNRANNSTASSWDKNVIREWTDLPHNVTLKANVKCNLSEGTVNMHFNPSGSSTSRYICIVDKTDTARFQVGVGFAATGRVVVRDEW